jgi:hypothetical protein
MTITGRRQVRESMFVDCGVCTWRGGRSQRVVVEFEARRASPMRPPRVCFVSTGTDNGHQSMPGQVVVVIGFGSVSVSLHNNHE